MLHVGDLPELLLYSVVFQLLLIILFLSFFLERDHKHSPVGEVSFFCLFLIQLQLLLCAPKNSAVMSPMFCLTCWKQLFSSIECLPQFCNKCIFFIFTTFNSCKNIFFKTVSSVESRGVQSCTIFLMICQSKCQDLRKGMFFFLLH